MDLKVVKNALHQFTERIPTRYDDITDEIAADNLRIKFSAYNKYQDSLSQNRENMTSYKLGDVLGEKLNKII